MSLITIGFGDEASLPNAKAAFVHMESIRPSKPSTNRFIKYPLISGKIPPLVNLKLRIESSFPVIEATS